MNGIPIAKVAGIRIQAHWSVILICALLAWGVATEVVPGAAPGTAPVAAWLLGFSAAILMIISLTCHELAHSLMARHRGVEVTDITLWMFGGVSHIRGDWGTAKSELLISIIGPATTLAVTVLFFLISLVLVMANAAPLAIVVPEWLTAVNLMILVFNLIPAFPLDGGRVLRSYLWSRHGNRDAATRAAARAGQAFGIALMVLGAIEFFVSDTLSGIWLLFIGWFLDGAARVEQQGETVRHTLQGVRVKDVMTPDPVVIAGWITAELLIDQYVMKHEHTTFPIRDVSGRIQGLVTLRVLKRIPEDQRGAVHLSEIAIPVEKCTRATPDEPLTDLLERVTPESDGRALVFEGEELVGIISPSDIARRLQVGELNRNASQAAA